MKWIDSYDAALQTIACENFDVCLLDYRLGDRDGLDLLREVNRTDCKTPFIFLTGYGDHEIDLEAMRAGAADYLVKNKLDTPFLERSLRYAIEHKRAEEKLRDYSARLEQKNAELTKAVEELNGAKQELFEKNRKLKNAHEQLLYQNEELIGAREEAEIERQRYVDLFEYAPDGYVVTDNQGIMIEVNHAAVNLLASPQDYLVGRSINEFVAYEDLPAFNTQFDRLTRLKGVRDWEIRFQTWGEPAYPVEVSVTTVLPRSDEGILLRWSIRDISRRKEAEDLVRKSEIELRFLSTKLLSAQEEERRRISREVHDSIGSSLTAIKLSLENAITRAKEKTVEPESLKPLVSVTQQAIEEARRIMTDLRPALLDDLGIVSTIKWFCTEYRSIYPAICTEDEVGLEEQDVPEPLKIVIFRIIQEAFQNIAKYSKAELVNLSLLINNDRIELTIEDNGIGFKLDSAQEIEDQRKGLGLTSMRERTELSGGLFFITSTLEVGTTIRSSWPIGI